MNIDKICIEALPRVPFYHKERSVILVKDYVRRDNIEIISIEGQEDKRIEDKDFPNLKDKKMIIESKTLVTPSESFMIVRKSIFRNGQKVKDDTNHVGFTEDPNFVFFIGSFKVGKTKISRDVCKRLDPSLSKIERELNQLNQPNPVVNTTGELLIELSQGKRKEVIIDTEGLNQVIKTKHSNFIKQFIIEHSVKFASMIFYVIEKFTPEELNSVFLLINQLKTHNSNCRFILIHNIRSIQLRKDLNTYIEMYFQNYKDLFAIEDGKTKANVIAELFSSTNLGTRFRFEEIFCCADSDSSYELMVNRVSDLIKNESRKEKGSVPESIKSTINKILATQSQSKDLLKEFTISHRIDVEKIQYNPASVSISERHRKAVTELNKNKILVFEFLISVPESIRDRNSVKITLEEVTIQIEVGIYDHFKKTVRMENFKLFEGLIISTSESTDFTNRSIKILENCAFVFLVKINEPFDNRHLDLPIVFVDFD